MSELTTTIAAVSTPPGKGGVALIRLSGEEAFAIADRCFRPRGKQSFTSLPPRTAVYGDLFAEGRAVDDGMALRFPAPHSYTGEDTVEFTCHGGVLITRTVLEALFAAGATPAGPGEFTRRAYLNGRLSLSEAEAIATLLDAKSHAQVLLSASRGVLSQKIDALYREALALCGTCEAHLDFPEEDLGDFTEEEMEARLTALWGEVTSLLDSYRTGRSITEGIQTVICGRPNVGKSTLYNAICNEEAAIVSDIPGTTRDVLHRTVPLGRTLLHLSDTAGIRESEDAIEAIGVTRARAALADAELILAVFDASSPLCDEDLALLRFLDGCGGVKLALLNKTDRGNVIETERITPHVTHLLSLSAKCGSIRPLRELVEGLFTDGEIEIGSAPILASARQYASLSRAAEHLKRALASLRASLPVDMIAEELKAAIAELGDTDGRLVNEAVVHEIFSHFCVGK